MNYLSTVNRFNRTDGSSQINAQRRRKREREKSGYSLLFSLAFVPPIYARVGEGVREREGNIIRFLPTTDSKNRVFSVSPLSRQLQPSRGRGQLRSLRPASPIFRSFIVSPDVKVDCAKLLPFYVFSSVECRFYYCAPAHDC